MNPEGVLACCAVCNEKTHRRCARCLNIYYCNTEHQRVDWRRHKSECVPKIEKQVSRNDKVSQSTSYNAKEIQKSIGISQSYNLHKDDKELNFKSVESESTNCKSKRKSLQKEGSKTCIDNKTVSSLANKSPNSSPVNNIESALKSRSVISSVVYTNKDLSKTSAITYEGSSEQEILSEKAQQLNTVEFSANVSDVNKCDVKMPALPRYNSEHRTKIKEYPEASLKGSSAPFSNMVNNYYMDPSDPNYEICHRVIRDMTQYGVCVLNNFLGRAAGVKPWEY
ncbi:unnamed protein product [Leptidea sinapis]|uniref:MYND-type domain-containing protein n=1 Tax=Leptidea sinapis TaxID=189913 RepID=A0A5E4PTB6_9NEOP|nr:unnamed protein product [Leptidea sinapis]